MYLHLSMDVYTMYLLWRVMIIQRMEVLISRLESELEIIEAEMHQPQHRTRILEFILEWH